MRSLIACAFLIPLVACVHRAPDPELADIQWLTIPIAIVANESYEPVPSEDADRLGCKGAPANRPICSIALPSTEEYAAFKAESFRLSSHPNPRCRDLSAAMNRNLPQVRMYPRALISEVGRVRRYGVGHSYQSARTWQIRIARRLTDLNTRSIDQKVRTFRHEVAHTLGASEDQLLGWSAEEYADRCGYADNPASVTVPF